MVLEAHAMLLEEGGSLLRRHVQGEVTEVGLPTNFSEELIVGVGNDGRRGL